MRKEILSKIAFSPVFQAQKGHGSFITVDLGKAVLQANSDNANHLLGEFFLWIYLCDWRLYISNQEIIASSNVTEEDNELLAKTLRGRALIGFDQLPGSMLEIQISFSEDVYFILYPNTSFSKEDDWFMLFAATELGADKRKLMLRYNLGKGFCSESSDAEEKVTGS